MLAERLRSRRPFVPTARNLLNNLAGLGIGASEWTNYKWNAEYCEYTSRLRVFIHRISARPVGMSLPGKAWVKLNRRWTGVGRFHSSMHNEVSLLHRIASVAPLSKPQTTFYCNSVPYTSNTTWSTRSDGFG